MKHSILWLQGEYPLFATANLTFSFLTAKGSNVF